MYKLIACDLDETILNQEHLLPDNNIQAIHTLLEKGIRFVPATGRGFLFTERVLKQVELDQKENEYVISFNGAVITENKNHEVIHFEGFHFDEINQLFQFGKNYDVCISICTLESIYHHNINEEERNRYLAQKIPLNELNDDLTFLKDSLFPKILFQSLDMNYLKEIATELTKVFGNQLSISYSSNRYLEINKAGVSKGDALLFLANKLGIKAEEIIAVGDNHNDISMLQIAGLAISPRNAQPEVKEISDFIGEHDNNQGILEEVVTHFIK